MNNDENKNLANTILTKNTINKILKAIDKGNLFLNERHLHHEEELTHKIDYFKSRGCTNEQINKIFSKFPTILTNSMDKIKNIYDILERFTLNNKQINKMLEATPNIISRSSDTLIETYNFFLQKGYSVKQVNKMIYQVPTILTYSMHNIKDKYSLFEEKNINIININKIIMKRPHLLSYGKTKINAAYNCLLNHNLSEEQVNKIIIQYPAIFSVSVESLNTKLDFYKQINLFDELLENNYNNIKGLMTGINVAYARYCHLSTLNKDITYKSLLNVTNNKFNKLHGITKENLLKVYPISNFTNVKCDKKRA